MREMLSAMLPLFDRLVGAVERMEGSIDRININLCALNETVSRLVEEKTGQTPPAECEDPPPADDDDDDVVCVTTSKAVPRQTKSGGEKAVETPSPSASPSPAPRVLVHDPSPADARDYNRACTDTAADEYCQQTASDMNELIDYESFDSSQGYYKDGCPSTETAEDHTRQESAEVPNTNEVEDVQDFPRVCKEEPVDVEEEWLEILKPDDGVEAVLKNSEEVQRRASCSRAPAGPFAFLLPTVAAPVRSLPHRRLVQANVLRNPPSSALSIAPSAPPPAQTAAASRARHRCPFCGKGWTSASRLAIHMRIHSGEKPHVCSQCGKAFAQVGDLNRHLRAHLGVRPFVCRLCGRAFARSTHLRLHMHTHGRVKPFACTLCPCAFDKSSQLRWHMTEHGMQS